MNINYKINPAMSLAMSLFFLATYVVVYIYLNKIEECKCELGKRHKFLKQFSIVLIIFSSLSILSLLVKLIFNKQKGGSSMFTLLLFIPILFLAVFVTLSGMYAIGLFNYVRDIEKSKCSCLNTTLKHYHNFLTIWRYFPIIAFAFQLLILLGSVIAILILLFS